MSDDEAKAFVLAKYPRAFVLVRRLGGTVHEKKTYHTVIGNTRYMGPWLSGEHHTEAAAWRRAARDLRRKERRAT